MLTTSDKSVSHEEMDINDSISASPASPRRLRAACPDVFPSSSLLDAVKFIIHNNPHQKSLTTLTVSQEEIFTVIEKLRVCPSTMFKCLHNHFVEHFGIYLHIIAFDNGKFSLMNKINDDKKYSAFITFNKDHTIRGPLFIENVNGTRKTVFTRKNKDIIIDAYMYISQLNDIESSTGAPRIQEQQAVYCEQDLQENNSTSADQFAQNMLDAKAQFRCVLDETLRQMFRVIDGLPVDPHISSQVLQEFVSRVAPCKELSPLETVMASKDGLNHLWNLVQMAEQYVPVYQTEQNGAFQPQLPDNRNHQTVESQNETSLNNSLLNNTVDVKEIYPAPKLSRSVEKTNHPRTLKEFAKTGSAPINCINSNQRDSIGVDVPPGDENTLHLDMQIVDIAHKTHLSKIPVPHETKAEDELLMNNNNLDCLKFDNCDKTYTFNRDTKHLYAEISSTERQELHKDIRIHMITLYQRGEITRTIIRNKQLTKCRLAFSFCILENGKYKRVSPIHYSDVIEDSKKCNNTKKKATKKGSKRLSVGVKQSN